MNDQETHSRKKSFFKTKWGILVAILFFPFFLTYWVWKQNWNPKVKYGIIGGFWLFGIAGAMMNPSNTATVAGQDKINTQSVAQTQVPSNQPPTAPPTSVTKITTIPFDKNRGNNAVASTFATKFFETANKAASGTIEDVRLDLEPEDMQGKSETEYKDNITSAFLTISINQAFWSSLDDDSKKNLVATFTNSLKNTFSGFPHISVTNGIRTVATGEWSVFSGEAKITLK